MNQLIVVRALVVFACLAIMATSSSAAEMTFQLINNTDRTLNLKLFSNGESHAQWPSKTRAYAVKPDATAVQQLKITCNEGEQICWGAWMKVETVSGQVGAGGQRDTRAYKYTWGAGDRGINPCTSCCHVCKDGTLTPVRRLQDASEISAK